MWTAYDPIVRIATWNLERKKPSAPRGAEAVDYLHGRKADIAVITEARTTFPTRGGHMFFAEPPTAPRFAEDERKIGIWSQTKLQQVPFDSPIDPTRLQRIEERWEVRRRTCGRRGWGRLCELR